MQTRTVLGIGLVATVIAVSVIIGGRDPAGSSADTASFVGVQVCAGCHRAERDLWSGSHHDLAMQVATEQTVLGDFDDSSFTHFGLTSTFYRRDNGFFVRTDGPDGELQDYEVKYTFGVTPLQQYLIELPGGKIQTLGICWDTRPASDGGQRWFHIYPDEEIPHDDVLHWTGPNQNWNFMCAECHSTNLQKNYDLVSDTYDTTWSEINVSCEACHGPGSNHVEWAMAGDSDAAAPEKGLPVTLNNASRGTWVFESDATTATRSVPLPSQTLIESCARCHSRRSVLGEDYAHGRPLMDTHLPALLEERLYHADGQILEEVYVYGSFLQSKMHQQGVTCSDCHEPHGLNLIATGNSLCVRCHQPETYDTTSHHFHQPGSTGASCVECHMPATTYMVVDPRRDHSIRIPRPDLSVSFGTPNACNSCHEDQPPRWAADAIEQWYGPKTGEPAHFAEALRAGRTGRPDAERALSALVMNNEYPAIARASGLSLLARFPGTSALRGIATGVGDEDAFVRRGALEALEGAAPEALVALAPMLLEDPVLAVRIEAARLLAPLRAQMTQAQVQVLDRVEQEYIAAQVANRDRPWAHINLGLHYLQTGRLQEAEASYRTALRLDPSSVQARVNLADLYRVQQQDNRGEVVLREALQVNPASSEAHHALGLLLARGGNLSEAITSLATSANLSPGNARFAYAHGLALNQDGQTDSALQVLQRAYERHRFDRDILWALATINRDAGRITTALQFARALYSLAPEDPNYLRLVQELERDG